MRSTPWKRWPSSAPRGLGKPLLVLHSPTDAVVGVDEARTIFETARHPKSFVSLDGADHLLLRPGDAEFVGSVIAAWAARYVADGASASSGAGPGPDVAQEHVLEGIVVEEVHAATGYAHQARSGGHTWLVDEPLAVGGADSGPGPYDVLLSALGACTSMTMRMYARRKGWDYPPARVTLRHGRIHAKDCETCETTAGQVDCPLVDRLRLKVEACLAEVDPTLRVELVEGGVPLAHVAGRRRRRGHRGTPLGRTPVPTRPAFT